MTSPIRRGVLAVVGDPRPRSVTAVAAEEVARRVAIHLRSGTPHVIDLAAGVPPIGDGAATGLAPELERVSAAAALVIASPTTRASYTGLLKSFLDLLAPASLRGAVAVPLMTLSSSDHALAADVHLRPVLQELGASLPTASLVLRDTSRRDVVRAVDAWWDGAASSLAGIGSIGHTSPQLRSVGPSPR